LLLTEFVVVVVVVVGFIIDSVWKLLDTPSYICNRTLYIYTDVLIFSTSMAVMV